MDERTQGATDPTQNLVTHEQADGGSGQDVIRVLSPDLASQIAAGEVVERPASVVKELCENSLDAGASRLSVAIADGGTTSIRVCDDGRGMTRDNAVVAIRSHATSKIRSIEDLEAIRTMGFRGEALASIASVSHFKLKTRPAHEEVGTLVEVRGDSPPTISQVGCAPGTTIEVSDLFFNVPARRKFLKKPSTEAAHVQETLVRLGLVRPNLHIVLDVDGRRALDLPGHVDLRTRVEAALTRRAKAGLHHAAITLGQTTVQAFLAGPDDSVGTARWCYLFVNGRSVRDRILLRSLTGGFGAVLPKGRYPVAVLLVEVPADAVDVNVHP